MHKHLLSTTGGGIKGGGWKDTFTKIFIDNPMLPIRSQSPKFDKN